MGREHYKSSQPALDPTASLFEYKRGNTRFAHPEGRRKKNIDVVINRLPKPSARIRMFLYINKKPTLRWVCY
jgi:hypothetical protein